MQVSSSGRHFDYDFLRAEVVLAVGNVVSVMTPISCKFCQDDFSRTSCNKSIQFELLLLALMILMWLNNIIGQVIYLLQSCLAAH